MLIATLDTSTNYASFVLFKNQIPILHLSRECSRGASRILPWISQEITKLNINLSDISEWRVGNGPGSFTGMRVGISFVKGVCFASGAKYFGINSGYAYFNKKTIPKSIKNITIIHDGRQQEIILNKFNFTNGEWLTSKTEIIKTAELAHYFEIGNQFITTMPLDSFTEDIASKISFIHQIDAANFMDSPIVNVDSLNEMEASCEPIYIRPAVFINPLTFKSH